MTLPAQVANLGQSYQAQGQAYAQTVATSAAEQSTIAQNTAMAQGMVSQSMAASGGDINQLSASAGLLAGAINILKNPKASVGDIATATTMLASATTGTVVAVLSGAEMVGLVTVADITASVPIIGAIVLAAAAVIVLAVEIVKALGGDASGNAPPALSDADKTRWAINDTILRHLPLYQDPNLPVTLPAIRLAADMSELLAAGMDAQGFPYIDPCIDKSSCTPVGTLTADAIAVLSPGQTQPAANLFALLSEVLYSKQWPTSIDPRAQTLGATTPGFEFNTDPSTEWGVGLRGTGITYAATDIPPENPHGFTTPATVADPNNACPSNEASDMLVYLICAGALAGVPNLKAYVGSVMAVRLAQYAWLYKQTQATGGGIDAPPELYAALGMMLDWQGGVSFDINPTTHIDTGNIHLAAPSLASWVNHYNSLS